MHFAKVGRRGQVTIPKAVREELKIEEGQRIGFVYRNGHVSLEPMGGSILDHYQSIEPKEGIDVDEARRIARRHRAEQELDEGSDE